MICKISNFDMRTAKHLADASSTELTLTLIKYDSRLGCLGISLSRTGIFRAAPQTLNALRLLQTPREVISLESRLQYRLLISNIITGVGKVKIESPTYQVCFWKK